MKTTDPQTSSQPEYVQDIHSVLIDSDRSAMRVAELGAEITRDYRGRNPLLVSVLRGTVIFFADLLRKIEINVDIDHLSISSYGPVTRSQGVVRFIKDLEEPVRQRDVIVVEDVIDTGLRMRFILRSLQARHPASLAVCTLLDKRPRRLVDVELKYVGFEIPDLYVVGYGLDYHQRFRNLPYIATLKPEVMQRRG